MLLQRLSEYAGRMKGLPPLLYQPVPVRYIFTLDEAGRQLGSPTDARTDQDPRGKARMAPDRKRTVNIVPKLLVDNAEYALGIGRAGSDPERVRDQHAAFVAQARDCAEHTGEPSVRAVLRFLQTLDVAALGLPTDFDPSANVTFEVDGMYPFNLPSVQAYWARVASAPVDTPLMQCLVCGELRVPVERLPIAIKGIPGGQTTGMALISANAPAFESYGLQASLIAPTCENCGQRFGNALNELLRNDKTHLRIDQVVHIFWTKEEADAPIASLFSKADDEEVRRFLTSPWRDSPEGARLDASAFYAAALSASGTRVVLRDWLQTTLHDARDHLARYFAFQQIRDAYSGQPRYFPVYALARATKNSKSQREQPPAQVMQTLLHFALGGGRFPDWMLYQVVRRTRAEQRVTSAHAALIKMVLLSQSDAGGNNVSTPVDLDPEARDAPYLCGRLLAELESLQRSALGKSINATVVDRYFGTASSAPALVFARLLRGAQPHLSKLRREQPNVSRMYDERLQDVLRHLPDFPQTLALRDQARFALGYYHQKASHTTAWREWKAKHPEMITNESPEPNEPDNGED
jgi:CRISPR-associated protein Csd1